MKSNYKVITFVMDSGGRYCMVVDCSSCLPVYYPTLFLTTQIRNRGDVFSTMLAAASNLIVLLRSLDNRSIGLEQRFLTKNFFKPYELDDLRDFAQRKQGKKLLTVSSTSWLEDANNDTVNNGTLHSRLTTYARRLGWCVMHILKTAGPSAVEQINEMLQHIKIRRLLKKRRNSEWQDRSLNNMRLNTLFGVIKPRSNLNPLSTDVQRRNRLMILLLFYLGIRGGELINIRI